MTEVTASYWGPGYLYLNGKLVAEYSNGTTWFAQQDHLGSTRLLTGVDGSGIQSWDFLPYGERLYGTYSTTHLFTADEHDIESNLDHTQFRQYSSALGRWMTPDPAGLATVRVTNPQSWNRYSYVSNRPLIMIDPSGLGQCAPSFLGPGCGGGDDGSCSIDEVASPCSLASSNVNTGAAAICPQNNCSGLWSVNQNGQFIGSVYNVNGFYTRDCAGTVTDPLAYGCGSMNWHPQGIEMGVAIDLDIFHSGPQCPTCGNYFGAANTTVNVATAITAIGVTGTVGAGVATSLEGAQIAVGIYDGNLHFAVGAAGEFIHGVGAGPVLMTGYFVDQFIEDEPFVIPFVVRNGQALLDTAGTWSSNCFTGACRALWNGWIH